LASAEVRLWRKAWKLRACWARRPAYHPPQTVRSLNFTSSLKSNARVCVLTPNLIHGNYPSTLEAECIGIIEKGLTEKGYRITHNRSDATHSFIYFWKLDTASDSGYTIIGNTAFSNKIYTHFGQAGLATYPGTPNYTLKPLWRAWIVEADGGWAS